MHCASAALAVIATFLGPGESKGLTNAIQQGRTRINAKMVVLAVDAQRDWDGTRDVGAVRDCPRLAALCGRAHRRAPGNDCGCGSTPHSLQKCPACRIRRVRLFVVMHTVSLSKNRSHNTAFHTQCRAVCS